MPTLTWPSIGCGGGHRILRQLFEFRAAVEPLVAARAAERIGPVELAMLDRLHEEEMEWPSVSRGRFRAIDVAIHKAIAAACRNQYLIDAVRDIRVWLAPGLDLLDPSRDIRNESVERHGQLIAVCMLATEPAPMLPCVLTSTSRPAPSRQFSKHEQ